jgi:hypothetical protein
MTLDIAAIVRAELAKFLKTGDAPKPAPVAVPPAVAKRTLSPEHLAKMQAGRKAKAAAKPAAKPAKAAAPKPVSVPARDTLDPVQGKRFVAEAYVSAKGVKSVMLGNAAKQGRLVFHDRAELVEWLNEARAQLGVDSAALADLHFGG